jgi:hypothetical protein
MAARESHSSVGVSVRAGCAEESVCKPLDSCAMDSTDLQTPQTREAILSVP